MYRIPLQDLARLHDSIRGELERALSRVLDARRFVADREARDFEEALAASHGAAGAVGCGSGGDGLAMALRALGVGDGDEVIVPAFGYVGTAESVLHIGATPVFADVDPRTLLITEASVAEVASDLTRAIVPVHLYGHCVPFDQLRRWRREGLWIVEDASHAPLATWRGEPVGSVGHAAVFGFSPELPLGALGDGGAVISRDTALLAEVRRLGNHGRCDGTHQQLGWTSRLDEIQAALLDVKLQHLADWHESTDLLADHYVQQLPAGWLVPWEAGAAHHRVVVRSPDRDQIAAVLEHIAIATGVHYRTAIPTHPVFDTWNTPTPNAIAAAATVLSVPMDPLMRTTEVAEVCGALLGTSSQAA